MLWVFFNHVNINEFVHTISDTIFRAVCLYWPNYCRLYQISVIIFRENISLELQNTIANGEDEAKAICCYFY
jgi:hydroxypyruvate isomerase